MLGVILGGGSAAGEYTGRPLTPRKHVLRPTLTLTLCGKSLYNPAALKPRGGASRPGFFWREGDSSPSAASGSDTGRPWTRWGFD
jgi:hypothetical protein